MRIQTGYGLEGALPDITCDDIIQNQIAPYFKAGNYEKGFAQGIDSILKAVRGEYKGSGKTALEKNDKAPGGFGLLGFLIFLFILTIALRVARRRGGYRYSSMGGPFIGGWSGGGWSSRIDTRSGSMAPAPGPSPFWPSLPTATVVTVMTVALSSVRRLAPSSRTSTTGTCANATSFVAFADGLVNIDVSGLPKDPLPPDVWQDRAACYGGRR